MLDVGLLAGHRQRERLRHVGFRIKPGAVRRNIRHHAAARQRAEAAAILRDAIDDAARRAPPFLRRGPCILPMTHRQKNSGRSFKSA